jgi:hypothetical protein
VLKSIYNIGYLVNISIFATLLSIFNKTINKMIDFLSSIPAIEWVGYLASITVAVSLVMSSILKLRWYNLFGAILFTTYAVIIGAWPVAAVNGFIIIIDTYYLIKLYNQKSTIKVIKVNSDDMYLAEFRSMFNEELNNIFSDYNTNDDSNTHCYMLLSDMNPAGFFIGKKSDKSINIVADFALPQYRDMKLGRFLYADSELFKKIGVDTVTCTTNDKKHITYMKKLGFKRENNTFKKSV